MSVLSSTPVLQSIPTATQCDGEFKNKVQSTKFTPSIPVTGPFCWCIHRLGPCEFLDHLAVNETRCRRAPRGLSSHEQRGRAKRRKAPRLRCRHWMCGVCNGWQGGIVSVERHFKGIAASSSGHVPRGCRFTVETIIRSVQQTSCPT